MKTPEVTALGFDEWFEDRAAAILQTGHRVARVTAVDRGAFLVHTGNDEIYAELAGRLRFETDAASDVPCVGDWVCVQQDSSGGIAVIHALLPRKTCLRRKTPGEAVDFQMIAANIDVAVIVQSCQFDFNIPRLNRYLVMASDGGIEPRIVLTKTDLMPAEELVRLIDEIKLAGISDPVIPLSNATGAGLDEFRALLIPGRTYCLLGSSGVGKTTLINRLLGREAFDTNAVSATGEGVHTTSRRHLLVLDAGAMLIDTPGMRELGLLGKSAGMDTTFPDIGEYSTRCKFQDCSHIQEPGCAVLMAVKNGELDEARYESYIKLKKEAEYHGLSYVEKRKKDRAFGRFVKSATKQISGKRRQSR